MENTVILSSKTLKELEETVEALGEPKFRAKQLHSWIYSKFASDFDEMSNISKAFKANLERNTVLSNVFIKKKQISTDGTVKYLVEFADGNRVECVLMRFDNRPNLTACVSSQIGCAVGCVFCATGKSGFVRNLTPQEIVEQLMVMQRDTKLRISNVVFMGQGEPLLNIDNVLKSIEIINTEVGIGIRRITVSTSGIIPGIQKLKEIDFQATVALSLHAPNSQVRQKLMPVENKYNINNVIKAMEGLVNHTGRRATIEYTIIKGVNDSLEDAHEVLALLKNLHCNINIIPYNPACNEDFAKPSMEQINKFKFILERSSHKVTVRLERGADIDAACGQLRSRAE
ncbi:MAG: 23S rRNA (adenine(2503)-C(2))-methyltransferase RlmN [Candidatus Gastranaerophilales bacterium]|nr:23S rRNA (adenine(2503)-C(2))-methyltransferase RlmN [Candidatus Gastranaerophilales bacterium]